MPKRPRGCYAELSMTCAVFCIGTEITRGELVNTNAAWLSAALTDVEIGRAHV